MSGLVDASILDSTTFTFVVQSGLIPAESFLIQKRFKARLLKEAIIQRKAIPYTHPSQPSPYVQIKTCPRDRA
jgi:hypothetical protein